MELVNHTNPEIDWTEVKEDIRAGHYWILDGVPYGEFFVSIILEDDELTINVYDDEGEALAHFPDPSEFLEYTPAQIENYLNQLIYFNYQYNDDF